ncbi:unnamed protein product [Brassica napus]|uniref:(rape) hypothetical protein n=1 Tax=Brassica napus TaxID=3708 RepID=A0A816VFE0_BRANA|nr:unnamed protein product [Brassica napus]
MRGEASYTNADCSLSDCISQFWGSWRGLKEISEYFHGDSVKVEAQVLRVFVVVRDFLFFLDEAYMMMVAKLVCTIFIQSCLWLLLLPGLTRAMESDITCLRSLKSQLKDPHAYLSNWVFGDYSDGYICSFFGVYCYRSSLNKVLSINLGGSGLEGEFPSGVKLYLSNNNLAGEIPASLPNMSYLNTLLLDHNRFRGRIPSELASSPGLLQFSVAHNDLKGPIPEFTAGNISLSSFDDNPDLCGFPLDPCQDSFYSMAIIAANIAAAAFFPVGACYGWLYDSHKQNQRPRRR